MVSRKKASARERLADRILLGRGPGTRAYHRGVHRAEWHAMSTEPTAVILQFPPKAIVREVPVGEFPEHWTGMHEHLYEHFRRCDGLSPKEAWARIEQNIADKREADALPPGKDKLLFLARLAMSRLPRR